LDIDIVGVDLVGDIDIVGDIDVTWPPRSVEKAGVRRVGPPGEAKARPRRGRFCGPRFRFTRRPSGEKMSPGFPHESLDVYAMALGIARWTRAQHFPARCGDLADQAVRASQSVVLNIAEGCGRGGAAGKNHFRMALGSAAELSAVLDLVDFPDGAARKGELRRVGAMLRALAR
jgi:four helix bundle protein